MASTSMTTKHQAQTTNESNSQDLGEYRPSSCELRDNCKGEKYKMTESSLAREGAFAELPIRCKLGGHLRRNSVHKLPKTSTIRAKATINPELLLFSKLGKVTAPKLGRGATTDGNPEGC